MEWNDRLIPKLQRCSRCLKWIRYFIPHFSSHMITNLDWDIQIKICAEYRDMLPRPRLVGRSPGVPDKSGRGLGSMSWYSAQILICFKANISHVCYSHVGLVGNFSGLPQCTVPSTIVYRYQNEAGHQIIKAPNMPCWGAAGPWNTLWHLCHRTGEIDR